MKHVTAKKRTTVYFDAELHKVLRLKAAEAEKGVSDLVNEAVRFSLAEDAIDLAAFEQRKKEKSISFEDALKKLRTRGKI
jgi:hypothetical protein